LKKDSKYILILHASSSLLHDTCDNYILFNRFALGKTSVILPVRINCSCCSHL